MSRPYLPHTPDGLPFNKSQITPAILYALEEIAQDIGIFLGKPFSAKWLSLEHGRGFATGILAPIVIAEVAGISDVGYILRLGSRAFWFSPTSWGLFALKIAAVVTTKQMSVLLTDFLFPRNYRENNPTPWLSNWDLLSPFTPWSDHTDRQRFAAILADVTLGSIIAYEITHHYSHISEIVANTTTMLRWLRDVPSLSPVSGLSNSIAMQRLTSVPLREVWGANRAAVAEILKIANAWKQAGLWGHPQVIAALQRFLVIDQGMVWPNDLFRLRFLMQRLGLPVAGNPIFPGAVLLPTQMGLRIPVATLLPPSLPTTPLTIVAPLTQAERQLSRLRRLAADNPILRERLAGQITSWEAEVAAADAEFARLWQLARTPATAAEAASMTPAASSVAATVAGLPAATAPAAAQAGLFRQFGRGLAEISAVGRRLVPIIGNALLIEEFGSSGQLGGGEDALLRERARLNALAAGSRRQLTEELIDFQYQQALVEHRQALYAYDIYVAGDPYGSPNRPLGLPARVLPQVAGQAIDQLLDGGSGPTFAQAWFGAGGRNLIANAQAIRRQAALASGAPGQLAGIALGIIGFGQWLSSNVRGALLDLDIAMNPPRMIGGGAPTQSEMAEWAALTGDHRSGPLRPGRNQIDAALSRQLDANLEVISQMASSQPRTTSARDVSGRWYRATPPYLSMIPGLQALWERALDYIESTLRNMIALQGQTGGVGGGHRAASAPYVPGPGRNFWLYRGRDRDLMLQTLRDLEAIVERDIFVATGKKTTKIRTRELILPTTVPWLTTAVSMVIDRLRYDLSLVRDRGRQGGYYSLQEAG